MVGSCIDRWPRAHGRGNGLDRDTVLLENKLMVTGLWFLILLKDKRKKMQNLGILTMKCILNLARSLELLIDYKNNLFSIYRRYNRWLG